MKNDDESVSGVGGCSVDLFHRVPAKNQYDNCLPSDVLSLQTSSLSQSLCFLKCWRRRYGDSSLFERWPSSLESIRYAFKSIVMVFVEHNCAIHSFVTDCSQRRKRTRPDGSHDLWPFSTPALLTGQPCQPIAREKNSSLFERFVYFFDVFEWLLA